MEAFSSRRFERGLRFVARLYLPRTVGLALGGLAVGTVLHENGAPTAVWIALVLTAIVWPHAAYWMGKMSADPFRAELRSLTLDSALGGAWIAFMHFNLLPSVLLAVMLSMDKLSAGGFAFLARCTAALIGGCLAAGVLTGFAVQLETTTPEVLGSLPLLVFYPLAVATTMYTMVRRMQYQNHQLEALSRTDGVSQMLTREAWEEVVGEEFIFCRRSSLPACLLFVHIDHLARVNDQHGYPVGDEVIRTVAAILRDALREDGVAGRFGGDRFGVLLRNVGAPQAQAVAERARERVQTAILERHDRVTGTLSIGIAEVNTNDLGYRNWISKADRALQAARTRGGNRIEHFAPPGAAHAG